MIKNYIKVAARNLLKNRAFSLINILGLAIGLAGFALIFLYVSFELSYDKFHTQSHNIYRVTSDQIVEDVIKTRDAMSWSPEGKVLYDELPQVINFTTTQKLFGNFTMRRGDQLFTEKMALAADTNFLEIFNYPVIKGDASDPLKNPNSIVLTRSLAEKIFGDEDPIGEQLMVYGSFRNSFDVTAVIEDVPQNTHYKFTMIISFESIKEQAAQDGWNNFNYYTYIKVSEGADLQSIWDKIPELSRKYLSEETTLFFNLQPIEDIHLYSDFTFEPEVHGNARTVYFLGVISLFIIVIAWVNYVNLSTAKAMDRAKEVGMRKVVGARKPQLIKQFLTESMIVNLVSAIIALTIIQLFKPLFNELIGKEVIISTWFNLDLLLTMSLLSILGTFLSGFYPALVLSSFQPVSVLKGKLRNSLKGILLRKGLVVFQFCASLALIAGTLIVYLQIEYMRSRDIGVDINQVVSIEEPYRFSGGPEEYPGQIETFQNQVKQISGVLGVGNTSTIPGSGSSDISSFSGGLRLNGEAESDRSTYYAQFLDENYIEVIGMKILAGRNFIRGRATDSTAVIVNESVLKRLDIMDPQEAINQYIQIGNNPEANRYTIIGVVKDYNRQSLKNAYEPILFFYNESRTSGYQAVKLSGNIKESMNEIERIWSGIFPNAPFEYVFLDDKFNSVYQEDRRFGSVFSVFAILAILIACLGLFGLSSFIAIQKTKEIGVRKVLGASVPSILFLLSKDFLQLILIGLAVGIPLVFFGMDQWLENYAFRINFPWWVFLVSGVLLVLITLLTVSFQTIKAAIANPSKALRYE